MLSVSCSTLSCHVKQTSPCFLVVCTVNCDTIFGWRSNVPLSTRSLFRLLRLHRPHFFLPNQAVAFQSNRHGDTCGQETQFQVITVHNCLDIRDLLQEVFSSSPSIKTAPVQRKLKMWLTAALIAQGKGDRGQIIWQYCSPGAFLFFISAVLLSSEKYVHRFVVLSDLKLVSLCRVNTHRALVASHYTVLLLRQTAITVVSNRLLFIQECVGTVWRCS